MVARAHRTSRTRSLLMMIALLCASSLLGASSSTLVAATEHAQNAMMDMPSDPVSGEMVMSKAYHFDLKNGQRLRFATQDTLTQFLQDPKTGLKGVESVVADASAVEDASSGPLCPVCGMETFSHEGPQVSTQHGEQVIKTCSMGHAHQVYDQVLQFQDDSSAKAKSGAAAPGATESNTVDFCTGPGTTMLNGFSFGRNGSPCVLLWFPGWVLATRWMYFFGCVGVVLIAVFNEYLLHLRRILRKESNTLKRLRSVPNGYSNTNSNSMSTSEMTQLLRSSSYQSASLTQACCPAWFRTLAPETQHLIHCFLHGFTIFIAYMLMLVSMTYDWVLFLSTIGGYMAGHYVFGERRDSMTELDQMNFP